MSDYLRVEVEGSAALAAAFESTPDQVHEVLIEVVGDAGEQLRDDWRKGARKSAGRHGKRYPASITSTVSADAGRLYADVGPEEDRRQGGMGRGFEYGSVHTPPHPDGAAAFAVSVPRFEKAVDDAVDRILHGAFG